MEFVTKNAEETKKLGREMAADLMVNGQGSMANVLALTGELGSGKTTFVQGLAEGLGIKQRVVSPTFILMKKYENNLYHLDLYRLEENVQNEVRNLGIQEIWEDPRNIVVIEWAEKIHRILPKGSIRFKFEVLDDSQRKVTINEL